MRIACAGCGAAAARLRSSAMKRDAAQTIFRTVVFAGAMLGTGACAKKAPAAAPKSAAPMTEEPKGDSDKAAPAPDDPCQGGERPRGADDDGGGGEGRGFILS